MLLQQERISEKYKNELKDTITAYEKALNKLKQENSHLKYQLSY